MSLRLLLHVPLSTVSPILMKAINKVRRLGELKEDEAIALIEVPQCSHWLQNLVRVKN